jgi:hypothetical protein
VKHHWIGLIELFIVLMFLLGWAVLEWVTSRMDRSKGDAGHAER